MGGVMPQTGDHIQGHHPELVSGSIDEQDLVQEDGNA
jgi:hypothetical protein